MSAAAPSADTTKLVDGGDLDVSGTFRATVGSDTASAFDAFSATSSEGAMTVHYEATTTLTTASGRWFFTVRGVQILVVAENFPTSSAALQWRAGDDVTWRAWYRPSTGQAGLRITVNGVTAPDTTAATTGGALVAPTSVSSNSAPSSISDATQWQTFVARRKVQLPTALTPEFLILGDSTLGSFWYEALQGPNVATWSNLVSVGHDVYSTTTTPGSNFTSQRLTRPGIGLLAVPSDTTSGQQSKFDASPWSSQSTVTAVIIEVGINDRASGAPTVAGLIQTLVNDVRAKLPATKIILAELVPYCLFDGTTTFLDAINADILGTGANPITGADCRVHSHFDTLTNGSDGYQAQYNFDNIHENNLGRTVVATAYLHALQSLGLMP